MDKASRTRQLLQFSRSMITARKPLSSKSSLSPVFIVGCGRSGNTLIRRVLMASGQVYIPPETYVLAHMIRTFRRLSYVPWANQVHMALGSISASQDFKYFPVCDYHSLTSKLCKAPRKKQTCADLLNSFYMEWARVAGMGNARWGDKTPMNSFCLDEIFATFPNAQFIYTQRSLIDVVASYLRMGRYDNAKDAAKRWISANQRCIHFREKNKRNVITVRYEDLVTYPRDSFSQIFEFLGLGFQREFLDVSSEELPMGDQGISHYKNINKKISKDNVGRGRQQLSSQDVHEIKNLTKHDDLPHELQELI